MKRQQERKSRKEIPNPQIKDVADQYDAARRILLNQLPDSGVLSPLLNVSAVAIELYLKCLSAEVKHTPLDDDLETYIVSAQPISKSHALVCLFDAIPKGVRCDLSDAFEKSNDSCPGCFRSALGEIEGVLKYARYHFEYEERRQFDLKKLNSISAFLHKFVADLKPRERIQWPSR